MTQRDLNRAVARATGESPCTIAQLGFTVADPEFVDFDPEPYDDAEPDDEVVPYDLQEKHLDWDALAEEQAAVLV